MLIGRASPDCFCQQFQGPERNETSDPEGGRTGEMLVQFQRTIAGPDGTEYIARACGGPADDGTGRWQGRIEFVPTDGGAPIRTGRETTQPSRASIEYWATGLSALYLTGALQRTGDSAPASARPAPARRREPRPRTIAPTGEPGPRSSPAPPRRSDRAPEVTQEDFEQAWRELSSRDEGRRAIGFSPSGDN
jgi:hypothetical protein